MLETWPIILFAILAFTYGIIYFIWFIMPDFAKEMIVFTVKTWIANKFTWKVRKDDNK